MSCAEAILSTLEVVSKHLQKNEKMYMCFYDLQKAFDSVEYPVLFKRLFEAGVNGKSWRLLHNWYNQPRSMVRINGQLTPPITLERGVLQGSVLSPILFLLVMDPLLRSLEKNHLGPFIADMYAGAFAHADDIRTVTSSLITLQHQINAVQTFADENALVLNPTKCEVLSVAATKPLLQQRAGILGNHALMVKQHAKCLGYWWSWDLSATRAIDEAIKKARRAFFAFGAMGAFHGKLNPISGRTIFEICVVPIFLYGCENWILTTPLLDRLEAFQGEIGRRILKLSQFHSTLSVRLALRWPSVPARILIQKLNLLAKISSDEDTVGGRIYSKLSAIDPQSLRIVQECKFLEEKLKCRGVTQSMLKLECSSREAKKLILKIDWESCLSTASQHGSTAVAARISSSVSWLKLWDMALDHGPRGTAVLQALYRTLTKPSFGKSRCSICDMEDVASHFEHHVVKHTPIQIPERIVQCLLEESPEIFDHARHF